MKEDIEEIKRLISDNMPDDRCTCGNDCKDTPAINACPIHEPELFERQWKGQPNFGELKSKKEETKSTPTEAERIETKDERLLKNIMGLNDDFTFKDPAMEEKFNPKPVLTERLDQARVDYRILPKVFFIDYIRKVMIAMQNEEMTFSRMVEVLNEDAYNFYKPKEVQQSDAGWISVEDAPKKNGKYSIWDNGYFVAGFYNGKWKSLEKCIPGHLSDFRQDLSPTHYMPLPAPPKQ